MRALSLRSLAQKERRERERQAAMQAMETARKLAAQNVQAQHSPSHGKPFPRAIKRGHKPGPWLNSLEPCSAAARPKR